MRDIRELLTEKESELERVRKEIQSLHAVIPLLEDERPGFEPDPEPVSSAQVAGAASSGEDSKSSFWNFGRRQGRTGTRGPGRLHSGRSGLPGPGVVLERV